MLYAPSEPPASPAEEPHDVPIYVRLTPTQAAELDRERQEAGGLSRSAMLRQLAVSQLRYRRYVRNGRHSRKKKAEVGKAAAPTSKPAAPIVAPEDAQIAQAILESIQRDPTETVNRIHAAHAARALGIPFSLELAQRWEPIVRAVREKYAMEKTAELSGGD